LLADVSGILIIQKAINHGDPRRYVSYLVDGKRSQRFFRTKEDAQNWKGRLRFKTADSALHHPVRLPQTFRAIPHLDPALQSRLNSAFHRPEIHPETRAKIEVVLKQSKNDET